MADVGTLTAYLKADTTQFVAGMQSAVGEVKAVQGSTSSAFKSIGTAFVIAGAVAVTGIAKAIDATVKWGEEVKNLQRITGQSAESASTLLAIGEKYGISSAKITTSLAIFGKNIVNASSGMTKYGLATKDAQGEFVPMDTVLGTVLDKFGTLKTAQDKATFATNVFGRGGRALIPILEQGRAGMEELTAEAQRMGLVMSQDDVDAAYNLKIAENELGSAFKGAEITIGKVFVPTITVLVHALTDVLAIVQMIPQPVILLGGAFLTLTGILGIVMKAGSAVMGVWTDLIGAFTQSASAVASTAVQATASTGQMAGQVAMDFGNMTQSVQSGTTLVQDASSSLKKSKIGGEGVGFAGMLSQVGISAGGAAIGLGLVTGALIAVGVAMRMDHDEYQRGLSKDLEDLAKGGAAARDVRRLARGVTPPPQAGRFIQPASSPFATRGGQAWVQQQNDISAAQDAVEQYNHSVQIMTSTVNEQSNSLRAMNLGLIEGTTVMSQLGEVTPLLQAGMDRMGGAFDNAARISGQDTNKILADLNKTVTDGTASLDTIRGAYSTALQQMRNAQQAWHDDIVASFGGAAAALDQFMGKAKPNFDKMNQALIDQKSQLKDWQKAFDTIHRSAGKASDTFLQDMSKNGLASIGIMEQVAAQPKKVRDQFIKNYDDVNNQSDKLANDIQDALAPVFKRVLQYLGTMIRLLGGVPPIKITADTTSATAAINALVGHMRGAGITVGGQGIHDIGLKTGMGGKGHQGGLVTSQGIQPYHQGGEVMARLLVGEGVLNRPAMARLGRSGLRALNSGTGGGDIKVMVRPDRQRFNRDLDQDYATRGW